mgnify:CR=1 FL=1
MRWRRASSGCMRPPARNEAFPELPYRENTAMAKEELIEMMGIANEVLPEARYRIALDNAH